MHLSYSSTVSQPAVWCTRVVGRAELTQATTRLAERAAHYRTDEQLRAVVTLVALQCAERDPSVWQSLLASSHAAIGEAAGLSGDEERRWSHWCDKLVDPTVETSVAAIRGDLDQQIRVVADCLAARQPDRAGAAMAHHLRAIEAVLDAVPR